MTRRTRAVLIDNISGKIYSNVSTVVSADKSKLIASTQPRQVGFVASSSATCTVTKNIGVSGTGLTFPVESLIDTITLKVSVLSVGSDIIVVIKSGSTYATSSIVSTCTLPAGQTSLVTTVSILVPAAGSIFADITQVGTTRAGAGLNVQFTYYTG
jgi:hypothetical protein